MSPKSQVSDSPTTISSLPRKMNECHLERGTPFNKRCESWIIFQASCCSFGFSEKNKNLMFHLLSSWESLPPTNPTNKQQLIPGPSYRSVADSIGSWSVRSHKWIQGEVVKSCENLHASPTTWTSYLDNSPQIVEKTGTCCQVTSSDF